MNAKMAEPKRTKASLSGELSDFLIEFSAALQKHAMYPAGHPVLGPSAESVFSRLSVLLASHGSLSIGVAREQLIIEGVATDSSHALLRSLADRLHHHELGAISFAEGVVAGVEGEIGSPVIMHDPLGQLRQDADFDHGFPSSLSMQIVAGQPFGADAMEPMQLTIDP